MDTCSKFLDQNIKMGVTAKEDLKKAVCITPSLIVSSDGKVSLMRGAEASAHNSDVFYYGYFGGDALVNINVIYSFFSTSNAFSTYL